MKTILGCLLALVLATVPLRAQCGGFFYNSYIGALTDLQNAEVAYSWDEATLNADLGNGVSYDQYMADSNQVQNDVTWIGNAQGAVVVAYNAMMGACY